jgi:dienelactone hydrolase
MPDCGSVGLHNLDFMQKAFERGYAAIVLDHHRGFRVNCGNSRDKPVKWLRMTKDAYDLAAFLVTLPNISKNRIYSIGGSEGGMIGGFLSSPGIKKFTAPDAPRYRANASLYGCAVFPVGSSGPQNTKDHMYIFNDMDRPLLWLMGEADNECIIKDELQIIKDFQKIKLPIEYYLYKDTTHCWDCKAKNGSRQTMNRFGSQVTVLYTYDQNVTNDSTNRVLDFFDKHK